MLDNSPQQLLHETVQIAHQIFTALQQLPLLEDHQDLSKQTSPTTLQQLQQRYLDCTSKLATTLNRIEQSSKQNIDLKPLLDRRNALLKEAQQKDSEIKEFIDKLRNLKYDLCSITSQK